MAAAMSSALASHRAAVRAMKSSGGALALKNASASAILSWLIQSPMLSTVQAQTSSGSAGFVLGYHREITVSLHAESAIRSAVPWPVKSRFSDSKRSITQLVASSRSSSSLIPS